MRWVVEWWWLTVHVVLTILYSLKLLQDSLLHLEYRVYLGLGGKLTRVDIVHT